MRKIIILIPVFNDWESLKKLIKESESPKSALIAIHDINIAARYSDKIMLLDNGTVKAFGPPKDVLTEQNIADVFGVKSSVELTDEDYIRVVIYDEI